MSVVVNVNGCDVGGLDYQIILTRLPVFFAALSMKATWMSWPCLSAMERK